MKSAQEMFLNKLRKDGNDKREFELIETKVTIQLYSNGFKLMQPKANDGIDKGNTNTNTNKEQFFNFNTGVNQALFNDIMESKFPLELLQLDKDKCNSIGVILEDYSKEAYFSVDLKQDATTITVKLANGKMFSQQFNLSHTLQEVIDQIASSELNGALKSFGLLRGYPPKEITQLHKTIKELNLEKETLIQQ